MTTKPPFPADLSEFAPPTLPEDDPESGTIAYITARLSRWARIAPPGMALATFESSLAREAVIKGMTDALTPDAIPVNHITLQRELPAIDHVRRLMYDVLPGASGILHVTGFQYAFTAEETVTEALRLFNYNRENLVNFPVQQVWWMTPELATTFENTVPELARYFLVSVRLTETIRPAADTMTFEMLPEGQRLSPQEARQLSRINRERFETAIKQPLTITEAVRLAIEAFTPLLKAGLLVEASKLWQTASVKMANAGLLVSKYTNPNTDAVPIIFQDSLNLSALAKLYQAQGLYKDAEPLYNRTLLVRKYLLGSTHPDTGQTLNELAGLYAEQGLYDKAEPLFKQALDICRETLGLNNSDTAASMNNLAHLYGLRGSFNKAEDLYLKSLAIHEHISGAMHPDTATSLNNLGHLYEQYGLLDKAEPLFIRTLKIREKVLGTTHSSTATILNNLAVLYSGQERYTDAEALLQRAYTIRLNNLGESHHGTQLIVQNIAMVQKLMKKKSNASTLQSSKLPVMTTFKANKSRGRKSR